MISEIPSAPNLAVDFRNILSGALMEAVEESKNDAGQIVPGNAE
jgi:hypothetical protein